jgi:hypothetical protein
MNPPWRLGLFADAGYEVLAMDHVWLTGFRIASRLQLACLGNDAGFTMLRIVRRDSEEEMNGQL